MTGRMSPPSRHCAVEFQALPEHIGQIRRIATAQLRYWGLDPLIEAAALGLTELLTNVHRHAGADKHCAVELSQRSERLTVCVQDRDPQLPRLRTAAPESESGRGLQRVAAVSASWGMRVRKDGSGKVVWFSLPTTCQPQRHPTPSGPTVEVAAPTTPGEAIRAAHPAPAASR